MNPIYIPQNPAENCIVCCCNIFNPYKAGDACGDCRNQTYYNGKKIQWKKLKENYLKRKKNVRAQ